MTKGVVKSMKRFDHLYWLLFIVLIPVFGQAREETLHNAITSSVLNESTLSDQKVFSQVSSQDLQTKKNQKELESQSLHDQDVSVADDLATMPSEDQDFSQNEAQNSETTSAAASVMEDENDIKSDVDKQKEQEDQESGKQPGVLYQEPGFIDAQESVIFNFEDTDLANVASYMEYIHKVKFLTEDMLSGVKDSKGLAGHKIAFRTNKVLTRKESWDLFITFLHIAGLDLVPMMQAGFYKIVPFPKTNGEMIPTYIGTDVQALPDNDMVIRYVYFTRNIDPARIQKVLSKLQTGSAKLDFFSELRALIFHDRASNIRSLMQIALEIDNGIVPECLSVIKLKRANAADVVALYKSLRSGGAGTATAGASQPAQPYKPWGVGKRESSEYFSKDVELFHDSRTNSLILLGSEKSIKKIEEFIQKYIDIDVSGQAAPPIFTYQLEYTIASNIATILNQAVQYGGSDARKYGSVRDGVKFFSTSMNIVPEQHSNMLIINATKDDFESILPLIKELDTPQPQIGLEVLMVQILDNEIKMLGAQISGPKGPDAPFVANQQAQTFAGGISAQTSGLLNSNSLATSPVVVPIDSSSDNIIGYSIKAGLGALLGATTNNFNQIVSSGVGEPGATLVTFGQPIWALFKVLQSMVSAHVVANPFVVVSNNVQANIEFGESRRVLASQVVSAQGATTSSTTPLSSKLGFTITPQINKNNIVNLQIEVHNNQFIVGGSASSALQDQKSLSTNASIANGEVLVLGGLMQEQYSTTNYGVPFLQNIPIFGWFFKSKVKSLVRSHFLIFICPRVIEAPDKKEQGIDKYTLYKMNEMQKQLDIMSELDCFASKRDPIQRAFFGEEPLTNLQKLTGQETTVDGELQLRDARKINRHRMTDKAKKQEQVSDAVEDASAAPEKKKDASKRKSQKKQRQAQEQNLSFDQDVVHLPAQAAFKTKNTISGSMQPGGNHV